MQLRDRYALLRQPDRPAPKRAPDPILPPSVRSAESRFGPVFYAEQFWPLDHKHGKYALEQAFDLDAVALDRLAEHLSVDDIRDAAFIDIETTGLSGGTGTWAFLVGVGSFEGFSFRLRQYFLAAPSAERAMLAAIAETVERKKILVSFNGRSFDVPQLITRYALHRLECFDHLQHVDLLLAARRLYRRSFETCRLGDMERQVLGLNRATDIPSWLIPSLYFSYMHRGQAQGLHPVFLHNALDILSLVTFVAHLGRHAGELRTGETASHILELARWDEARGRTSQAAQLYESVLARDQASDAGGEAAARLARLNRRAGDWQESERIWRKDLDLATAPLRQLVACIELAKVAEHKRRNPQEALDLTQRAEGILTAMRRHERPLSPTIAEVQRRLSRLEARVSRSSSVVSKNHVKSAPDHLEQTGNVKASLRIGGDHGTYLRSTHELPTLN